MAQADAHVTMPRRGFLARALGLTAASATMALPTIVAAPAARKLPEPPAIEYGEWAYNEEGIREDERKYMDELRRLGVSC